MIYISETRKKTNKILLAILLILIIFFFIQKCSNDYFNPSDELRSNEVEIKLFGSKNIILDLSDDYNDLGAQVFINGESVSGVEVDLSKIDINKPGDYEVIYKYNYKGKDYEEKRILSVVDKDAPVIVLKGSINYVVYKNDKYLDPEFEVTDNYDKNLAKNVKITGSVNTAKTGKYVLTYNVCDSSNNCSSVQRVVEVLEKRDQTLSTKEENYVNIEMLGLSVVYLEWPNAYVEAGYNVYSSDGNIENKVVVSGNVNSQVLGEYNLEYKITNSKGKVAVVSRKIIVRDTIKPVLTLNGEANIKIKLGDSFLDPGVIVTDNHDGIISLINPTTNLNINVAGRYYVKYTASDSSGNISELTRYIEVQDNTPPSLEIESMKENVLVGRGDSYEVMDGVSAFDNLGNNITTKITWTSEPVLNLNLVGVYEIIYRVRDANNNEAQPIKKIITVEENSAPTAIASYSSAVYTKENIIATIVADKLIKKPSGWTMINETTYTKIYLVNEEETVIIEDLFGNVASVKIIVNKIDREAPIITILGTNPYFHQISTVYIDESAAALDNFEGDVSTDIVVTGTVDVDTLGSYQVTYMASDSAGNESTAARTVHIVNNYPSGEVTYNRTILGKENVLATLLTDKEVTTPVGWINSGDNKTFTKEYEHNVSDEIVEFVTLVGNYSGKAIVNIQIIDKVKPTALVKYSTSDPTENDIKVTLEFSKPVQNITGWTKIDEITFTKDYSTNVNNEEISFKDLLGNEGKVNITINNIDKVLFKVEVDYDKLAFTPNDVIAEFTSSRPLQEIPEGWTLVDSKTYTKKYAQNTIENVSVTDIFGNNLIIKVEISNIDKVPPVITSAGNPQENIWTKEEVLIVPIIKENESGMDQILWNVNGGAWKEDWSGNFSDEQNVTIGIKAIDNAGNESAPIYTILKIDKLPQS